MPAFPLFINLQDKQCLIVGGGNVAMRKAKTLLNFTSFITVISPEILPEFKLLNHIVFIERPFHANDLDGKFMVMAATDNLQLNHSISQICIKKDIVINSATSPDDCTFFFPSSIIRGNISIGISTGGRSPLASKIIKEHIEKNMPQKTEELSDELEKCRIYFKSNLPYKYRKAALDEVAENVTDGSLINDEFIKSIIEKYKG